MENYYVPTKFHLYLKKLSNYRKTKVRLQPLSKSSFNAGGDVITFELPGAIIDPSSFSVYMKASATTTGDGTVALPANVESLFNRYAVYVGGSVVNPSFQNANLLFTGLYGLKAGEDVNKSARSVVHNSQPAAIATTAHASNTNIPLILNQIPGFLSVPHYLDCSLLGGIRIEITTERGNVCAGNSNNASFVLNDVHAYVDCIELTDDLKMVYDQAVLAKMKNGGISFGFKNYYSFVESVGTMAGSIKFSVASQSVNKIIVIPRASTYATVDNHSGAAGYLQSKYLSSRKSDLSEYYFQIAGRQQPSFNVKADSAAYLFSLEALGLQHDVASGNLCTSKTVYETLRYAIVHSLEYVGDDKLDRAVCGLDSRGAPNMYLTMIPTGDATGAATQNEVNIFVETTATLKVLAPGVVQVEA